MPTITLEQTILANAPTPVVINSDLIDQFKARCPGFDPTAGYEIVSAQIFAEGGIDTLNFSVRANIEESVEMFAGTLPPNSVINLPPPAWGTIPGIRGLQANYVNVSTNPTKLFITLGYVRFGVNPTLLPYP